MNERVGTKTDHLTSYMNAFRMALKNEPTIVLQYNPVIITRPKESRRNSMRGKASRMCVRTRRSTMRRPFPVCVHERGLDRVQLNRVHSPSWTSPQRVGKINGYPPFVLGWWSGLYNMDSSDYRFLNFVKWRILLWDQ